MSLHPQVPGPATAPGLLGPAPKEEGGSCPTHVPPRSPVVPCRRGDRREPLQLLKGAGKGGEEPRPSLGPRRPRSPMAMGAAPQPPRPWACCCPGCRGARGSCCCCTHPGAGRQSGQSPELSPECRLPWLCSLLPGPGPGQILPCFGLIHSHPRESVSVAPMECVSVHVFVQGVQRAVPEPAAANKLVGEQQQRCRQPGGEWGGGTAPSPCEGQSAARAGPQGSTEMVTPGTGACGPAPAPQPAFTKQTTFTAQLNTGSM